MRRQLTLGFVIVTALFARTSEGAVIDATWLLNGNGNWTTAANWDTGVVPSNSPPNEYNVRIDNDPNFDVVVTMSILRTINNLTVDAGDELSTVNNGTELRIAGSSISNNGKISLNGGGIFSGLVVQAPLLTLSGTGTMTLDEGTQGIRIVGSVANNELINGATHTIAGSAFVGIKLTNQGLINANDSGQLLRISASPGMTNTGTLQASGGGTLRLQSGTIDSSAGGMIHAADGSIVELGFDGRIVGGTFTTAGSGRIQIRNNDDAIINGTITNNGQWEMKSTGALTTLKVDGAATLTGNGTLSMVGNQNNRMFGAAPLSVLTNDVAHTIAGQGQLGGGEFLSIVNKGTIHATDSAPLVINTGVGTFINESSGLIRVSSSGGLQVSDGINDNQGTVEVLNGSILSLGRTLNTGTIELGTSGSAGGTLLSGNTVTNGASGNIQGHGLIDATLVNHGKIEGNSNTEYLEIEGMVSGAGVMGNVHIDGTHIAGAQGTTAIVPLEGSYQLENDLTHLAIDIGGLVPGSEYDQLNSIGDVSLDGILDVTPITLANSYVAHAGDRFTIIESTNPIAGAFDVVNLPAIAWGRLLTWKPVDYSDPNEIVLEIASAVRIVPEPSSALVLLFVWGAVVRSSRVGRGLDRFFS